MRPAFARDLRVNTSPAILVLARRHRSDLSSKPPRALAKRLGHDRDDGRLCEHRHSTVPYQTILYDLVSALTDYAIIPASAPASIIPRLIECHARLELLAGILTHAIPRCAGFRLYDEAKLR